MFPEKFQFAEQLGQAEANVRLVCEYLDMSSNSESPVTPNATVLVPHA